MIKLDKEKIIVIEEKSSFEILLNEIYKISLYKYDFISHEVACLCIDLEYGEFFELFEDMQGWNELIENLRDYLSIEDIDIKLETQRIKVSDGVIEIYKKEA